MISHSDICKRCNSKSPFFDSEGITLLDVTELDKNRVAIKVLYNGREQTIPCEYDENCEFKLEHMVLSGAE